jgi:hypothetical protein
MRLSWYADTGVSVFSIWQGGTCTGTFRLPMEELPRLIDALQRGMQGADQQDPRGNAGYLNQLPGAPTDPRLTALPGGYSGRDPGFTGPVTGDFRALRSEEPVGTVVFSPGSPRALPPGPAALPAPTPPQSAQGYLEDYSAQYPEQQHPEQQYPEQQYPEQQYPEQRRPGRRRLPAVADGYADTTRYQSSQPGTGYPDQRQYPQQDQGQSYGGPGYQDQGYGVQPGREYAEGSYAGPDLEYGYADQGYSDQGYGDQGYARSAGSGQSAPEQSDRAYPAAGYSRSSYPEPSYADAQYSDAQYSDAQYSEAQYSGPQYSDAQYSEAQYSGPQYSDAQYSEAQYSAPQYSGAHQAPGPQ